MIGRAENAVQAEEAVQAGRAGRAVQAVQAGQAAQRHEVGGRPGLPRPYCGSGEAPHAYDAGADARLPNRPPIYDAASNANQAVPQHHSPADTAPHRHSPPQGAAAPPAFCFLL